MVNKRRSNRLKKKVVFFDPSSKKKIYSKKRKNVTELNTGIIYSLPEISKNKDEIINWSEWKSATSTKNYLMEDSFLDIVSCNFSTIIKSNTDYSKDIGKMINLSINTTGFIPNLLNSGNVFENKIISLLSKELGLNNVKNIGGNQNARSTQKYQDTINALNDGIPCIFQGILRNYDNKTYGVPDILIRSDWINNFLDINALLAEEINISAPKLNNPQKNTTKFRKSKNKNVRYHYVVIDIKYKTLPLRSDGIHLRNDGNMKAYKSQLLIYRDALTEIQGYSAPYAFILGSKWKYSSSNTTFEGNSCFERLGKIDYNFLDKSYIEKTKLAIEWLEDVRTNGEKWDLSKYPLKRDEMYPNMCNRYDFPYHGVKKTFAETNGDLTLLWNVGPKQRRIANSKGIYTWKDPNCTAENLGLNGKIKSKVLGRILEANHSEGRTIYPKYITNNFEDWKNEEGRNIELFVDFETTCSVFSEMEDLPLNTGIGLIFLIGAGYINPKSKEWVFHKFVVNSINETEELRICEEFISFLDNLKKKFKIKGEIPCFHWASHEPSTWRRVFERNCKNKVHCSKKKAETLYWVDLLKVFILEPIGIKGVLNFGLKNVSKSFYKHGFISTTWESEGECSDGTDAAVGAYKANLESLKNKISFAKHSLTLDIIKYNEVDCKVLYEIIYYLREHHIDHTFNEEINSIGKEYNNKKRKIKS